jgi:hypothetical protein
MEKAYVDVKSAFTSVSHKATDASLGKAGASDKTRRIFRLIYSQARCMVRVTDPDTGVETHSELYPWDRGTWQGAGSSPVLFCILLHHMMITHDPEMQDTLGNRAKCRECRSQTVVGEELRCPVCTELLAHAQDDGRMVQ